MEQFVYKPNRVSAWQRAFAAGDLPVHLRGPSDRLIYRSIMGFSVIGLGIAFWSIFAMSTNRVKHKRAS